MPEPAAPTPTPTPDPAGASPEPGQDPTPQPDTDWEAEATKWKAMARKHEEQAKANVTAARRLAELEDAQKTEAQKLTDRATTAEREAEAARLELARYRVAASKGLPADLAEHLVGVTEEDMAASADRLLAAAAKIAGQQPPGPPDLKQGAGRAAAGQPGGGDWMRTKFNR